MIQAIKEHRSAIMKRINNKPLRDLLASKQRQLRVEKLRIFEGKDPGATASAEAIAAEMRSLSNDVINSQFVLSLLRKLGKSFPLVFDLVMT